MSRRSQAVFGMSRKPAEDTKPASPAVDNNEPMSGNWSRIAFKGMEEKLGRVQEENQTLLRFQLNGIVEGRIPVEIPVDAITDDLGTDRVAQAETDESDPGSFESLKENIKRRGQRTPIRVRPADPKWTPDPNNPFNVDGQTFLLQSGRRRLAACEQLGLKVVAFLSFSDEEQKTLEDLYERFFENVSRRDLTAAEKLHSIGLISQNLPDMTQSQIAEILQVSQADVSKGKALLKNYDALAEELDLANASMREIEAALKRVQQASKGKPVEKPDPISAAPALPFEKLQIGESKLSLTRSKAGVNKLTISSKSIDDGLLSKVLSLLEKEQK